MPSDTSYVTPSQVCSMLGWDDTDATLTSDITALIPIVSEAIDDFCNTHFLEQLASTKTYSGNDTKMLVLNYFCRSVTNVTSTDSNGVTTDLTTYAKLAPNPCKLGGYRWIEIPRNYSKSIMFPTGVANITVTGDWGFATIPQPVKLACALSIQNLFNLRNTDFTKQREVGVNRDVWMADLNKLRTLHPVAEQLLMKYKNSSFIG